MIRRAIILALLAMGLAAVPLATQASAAPSVPTGFKLVSYDAGMFEYDLTGFVTIPGTQTMLATGKSGRMTRVDVTGDGLDPSDATATIIGNLPTYYQGDRGLLGLTLAQDYLATNHVFVLWDYCQSTTIASDDQACLPKGGLPTGRLSRLTLTGPATAPTGIDFTSEVVLMDNLPSWSPTPGATCTDSHTVGTVVTAPDGTLFVGNGDGSSYCGAMDPSSLSAQDITSPRGKIFHINPNGSPAGGDIPGSYQNSVWAYGLRNPFRFSIDGSTLRVGDVGWNTTEEQDIVASGQNMGWPCLEGDTATPLTNSPQCNASFTSPLLTWPHVEVGRPAQSAAVGGVMYTGTDYPPAYRNYWFGDYARGDLFVGDHQHPFGGLGQWGALTDIQVGLGGDVMVSDIGALGTGPGRITRIHYVSGDNAIPVAHLTGTPLVGQAPLTTIFSPAAGDPDGTITTWTMDFGDGSLPLSALNQPPTTISHSYLTPGAYRAVLRVTDNQGATASDTVTVTVGNNAPLLTVVPPTGPFHVGDAIQVVAAASDPDNDAVSIQYQPVIHHCPSDGDCHVHPGAFQDSPDFVFPNHGDNTPDYYLEIVIKATDARGGTTTKSVSYTLAPVVNQPPPAQPPPPTIPPPTPPTAPGQPSSGLKFNPQPPQRLLDTRQSGHLAAATPLAINLGGHKAALLTVTVTNPADTGYLRVYPCSLSNPQNSTVNYNPGQTISNITIVNIPNDGQMCLWSLKTTDAVVDLSGYFDTTGLGYLPGDPLRLFDTRQSFPFGPMNQVEYNISGGPADAQAAMMNLTVTDPLAPGFLRVYPCTAEGGVSNVNYYAGQTIANFATVETSGGAMCFRSYAQTDVITDLAGWYVQNGGATLQAVEPTRLFDTRSSPGFQRLVGGKASHILMGLPPGTQAGVLNVTVADPAAAGYLSVYPCSSPNAPTSNVNYVAHQTAAANMTVVKVPADGVLCFLSQQDTDLIVDVSGWFTGDVAPGPLATPHDPPPPPQAPPAPPAQPTPPAPSPYQWQSGGAGFNTTIYSNQSTTTDVDYTATNLTGGALSWNVFLTWSDGSITAGYLSCTSAGASQDGFDSNVHGGGLRVINIEAHVAIDWHQRDC